MIITMTLISHITVAAFKPMNLWKAITRTQTIEVPVKPSLMEISEAFRRAA